MFCTFLISCAWATPQHPSWIEGDWEGVLKYPEGNFRVILHVTSDENGLHASMDDPDQAKVLVIDSIVLDGNALTFQMRAIRARFNGTANAKEINGTLYQVEYVIPVKLSRIPNKHG